MTEIRQIYHVARCGSTLLTFILSQVSEAYSECKWAQGPLIGVDPFNAVDRYSGSVVKFPSMVAALPVRFAGKKVFLYRPLAQHLCKIKTVETEWLKSRELKMDHILKNVRHPALANWEIRDLLDKVMCIWACSVLRMLESTDVLWIRTNDFIENRRDVVDSVCDHFGLDRVPNLNVSYIDAKKIGINGKDDPVHVSLNNNSLYDNPTWTTPSHGVIKTQLALFDEDIKTRLEYVERSFPDLRPYLY